jgi:hypothetical protein
LKPPEKMPPLLSLAQSSSIIPRKLSFLHPTMEELVITKKCYIPANVGRTLCHKLQESVAVLALRDEASPSLHLTIHMGRNHDNNFILLHDLLQRFPPVPITCDFDGLLHHEVRYPLELIYNVGGVVHLMGTSAPYSTRARLMPDFDILAQSLGDQLRDLDYRPMCSWKDEARTPAGQIFLFNVPQLVLDPEDLSLAAENAKEVARLKIFRFFVFDGKRKKWSDSQKWEFFASRLKFVDPGFRPSRADVNLSVERRLVIPVRNRS